MLRQEYQDIRAALSAVDEVLKNISALDKASDEGELNRILPALLASMGRYAAADRAYLFGWTDEKRLALHMTHEWCAPGVRPTMDEMQDLRMADMPNWAPRLRRGEAIVSDNWDAERERTPEEFRLFDGQDIHALMVIPILANQTLSGYIGFDNPDQSTSALSVRLLTSIVGHLGSLRENLWMMAELEEKRRTLQENFDALSREKHVLDALSIDYTSVYYCDLEADTMLPMKQGADTNAAVADSELTSGHQKYSFRIRYYYENFVVQESAQDFLEKMSADYLRAYLKEKDRFAYRFRTHPNPAGQQYFEVQVVRLRDMPGFKAVMGYRYIDDIVLEQERQRQQLEQALSTATTNSEIVDSISKIYWLIYRMDLVSGIYEEVSAGQEMHRLTGKWGRTDQVFQEVRETIVAQEHQEQMRRFLDTSTLPQRLRDTESVAMEYHAASGSWHLARFIVKKRDKVMQASGFLLDLVNDVLDMNRLESGTIVLEHKPFDLTELLEETCGIIQMQGQAHRLRFQAQPWGIQHPHLLGSPLHLRQVLQNIGGNAVKYNRDGGSITIRCEETGCADGRASFRFVCDDTGRGMSREFQKHAFEPFTPEEYGARTSYTGTGLGLSIAKQLVEKMGGDVRIQSQRDVGTRVEIDLSFDVDQSYEAAARQTEQEERIDLTGVRVLLVEDNDLNMECARFTLERVGHGGQGGGRLCPVRPGAVRPDPDGRDDARAGRPGGHQGHPGHGSARRQRRAHLRHDGQRLPRGHGPQPPRGDERAPVQAPAGERAAEDHPPVCEIKILLILRQKTENWRLPPSQRLSQVPAGRFFAAWAGRRGRPDQG